MSPLNIFIFLIAAAASSVGVFVALFGDSLLGSLLAIYQLWREHGFFG